MIRVLFVFSGKPCYDECFSPIVPLMSSKSYDLYLMLTFKGMTLYFARVGLYHCTES